MILRPLRQSALRSPFQHSITTPRTDLPFLRRQPQPLRSASTQTPSSPSDYLPPPAENAGPLLSRLPNRALPTLKKQYLWLKTLPIFILLITLSSLAIFNYQKSSSSTVNSILYALRTNATARELLGDEIYFASKVPWIWGELNQLHGRINISFWVKGRKQQGKVKFVSVRKRRDGYVSHPDLTFRVVRGMLLTIFTIVRDIRLELGNRGWKGCTIA